MLYIPSFSMKIFITLVASKAYKFTHENPRVKHMSRDDQNIFISKK